MTLDKTELKKIIESWSNKMHSTFFWSWRLFYTWLRKETGSCRPCFL